MEQLNTQLEILHERGRELHEFAANWQRLHYSMLPALPSHEQQLQQQQQQLLLHAHDDGGSS